MTMIVISGIFEEYNFTIDENTSIDTELSIDPEMLGRIFENLLAEINPETGETARKSTGSYYTPRPIVDRAPAPGAGWPRSAASTRRTGPGWSPGTARSRACAPG